MTPCQGRSALDLERCLHFATHCFEMYEEAPSKLRRQMNQAVFEKFFVDQDWVLEGRLARPCQVLLNPHLVVRQRTAWNTTTSSCRP